MQYRSTRKAVFSVKYHVIWYPKYRRRVLGGAAERRLKQIIGEVVTEFGGMVIEVETMPDHVHLLVELPPQVAVFKLVQITIEGVRAAPGYAAYAAAKAGVINDTKTAAFELAPHGIRVNAIAPDFTLTEGLMQLSPEGPGPEVGQAIPVGRSGDVDEIASTAVFLASEMASYITGQTIHVDGGTQAAGGWYRHPDTGDYKLGPG